MKHDEVYYLRRAYQCAMASKQTKSWSTKLELFALRARYLQCLAVMRRKDREHFSRPRAMNAA